jgi:hypothetical protein
MNWLRYDAAATDLRTINKTIFNTDVIKNDMSSLGKMMAIDDSRGKLLAKEKPIVTGYGSVMFGDSYRISRNYTKMLGEMQNFMGNFMPHAKADFQVVTLGIKELVNKSSFDETLYDEISKFSMTYLLARPDSPVAKYFKPEYYIPLLYKQPKGVESNTVVDKLNAVKNMLLAGQLPDLVNNRFLASVEEHPDNAREKVLALKFNNGAKLTPSEQDDLIENFNDLFKHPNPVVRDLAEALLAYNIVAKGLKSGVDSFADLVPMDVMGDINAYMNRVIYSDNLEETLMFMATQFVENHTHLDGLISFVSKPLLEKATVTEQYIDFSSDVKAAIAMGQLKVKAKYAKAYVGNKIVTYRWNDKFNRYEGVERVGDKLSKVPVAKGVKYKLYELYTADSFAQVAAMQEEIDQRSECETGFGGGPSPDDFGPPSDIFFGGNFGGPNFDYPDFGPGPEIFY